MSEQMIILIGQLLLQYGPGLAQKFVEIWHKDTVTVEDWRAAFALAQNPIARLDAQGNIVVPAPNT